MLLTILKLLTPFLTLISASTLKPDYLSMSRNIDDYLGSRLASYDLIESAHIVSKRSLTMETETLQFKAFNRTFRLVLVPNQQQSVSADLLVEVVDDGAELPESRTVINLLAGMFSGHVAGDPASSVSGYFFKGQFVCTIHTKEGQVMNIEPVSMLTGNWSETRLLVYYDSQLRNSPESEPSVACGFEAPPPPPPSPPLRQRRAAAAASPSPSRLVCSLQVVADHAYFRRIGASELGATVRGIVKLVDDTNEIFYATELTDPDSGQLLPPVGFELASIVILTSPDSNPFHFNAQVVEKEVYRASQVLEAFGDMSRNGSNRRAFCLSHLLTYRRMERNILGLAYVDAPCRSPNLFSKTRGMGLFAQNVGITSHSDLSGYSLLLRRGALVTVHELGHNMGALHDPAGTAECTPGVTGGGAYVMYEKSVDGFMKNNELFSPCSVRTMSVLVKSVLRSCLRLPNPRLCGNHRRDGTEQCDSGPGGDVCCSGDCRLRDGAVCSDAQSPCCLNCQMAPKGSVCLGTSPVRPCLRPAVCNGASPACPVPARLADGSACDSGVGRCRSGACQSACAPLATACACPTVEQACQLCCRLPDGDCAPILWAGRPVFFPVEAPCGGESGWRCRGNGTCAPPDAGRVSGRLVVRLFELAGRPGGGSLATNSIVFMVLAVTLILWVPASLLCHYRDQQIALANQDSEAAADDVT